MDFLLLLLFITYLKWGSMHGADWSFLSLFLFFFFFFFNWLAGRRGTLPIPFIIPKERKGCLSALGRFYFFWEYGCLRILIMDTKIGLAISHTKWDGFWAGYLVLLLHSIERKHLFHSYTWAFSGSALLACRFLGLGRACITCLFITKA